MGRRDESEAEQGPSDTDPELEAKRLGCRGEAYFPLDYGQIIHQVAVCVRSYPEDFTMPWHNISPILAHDRL